LTRSEPDHGSPDADPGHTQCIALLVLLFLLSVLLGSFFLLPISAKTLRAFDRLLDSRNPFVTAFLTFLLVHDFLLSG